MPVFINRPEDCPHTETEVIGYEPGTDKTTFTQVRQCAECGLYQRVTYPPRLPELPFIDIEPK